MPLTENDTIRIRQFLQRLDAGLIEGMEVFVTYHDSNLAATPSNPTGDGTTGGWHRLPTEASNWMSVKTALRDTAGTWGTPIRVFGLQGTETAGVGQSADIPKLSQITFIGDGSSKVGWTGGTVEYGGNSYAIAVKAVGDGSTDEFIYWDDADGQTSFKHTDDFAVAIAANHWVVCINDSGKAIPATSARILHGGLIQAGTITAAHMNVANLAAINANLGTVTAGDVSACTLNVETADIVNLSVETIKIKDNAVTIPKSAYISGSMTLSGTGNTENTIATAPSITVEAGDVVYVTGMAAIMMKVVGGENYSVRMYRDGTKIYDSGLVRGIGNEGQIDSVAISEVPGAGSFVYTLRVFCVSAVINRTATGRTIKVLATKK